MNVWPLNDIPARKSHYKPFWAIDNEKGITIGKAHDEATAKLMCPKNGSIRFVQLTEEICDEHAAQNKQEFWETHLYKPTPARTRHFR
jgi:hypothetical protein